MNNLPTALLQSVLNHRQRTALRFDDSSYTYDQLYSRAAIIQSEFLQFHRSGEPVAILANQDFDTYAALVAALLSGITFVPVEPSHPEERNKHILSKSGAKMIFCSDPQPLSAEFIETHQSRFIRLRDENQAHHLVCRETADPAYILFTSGSTGIPKGVPISRSNLESFLHNVEAMQLSVDEHSKFLQVFDLTFDLSVFSYLVPLLHGATVYPVKNDRFRPLASVQLIQDESITHVLSVPSFVSFLQPYFRKIELSSVKYWLFCGEALKSSLVAAWQKCVPAATVFNVYGPTEATIFCTQYECPRDGIREHLGLVSIGKPFRDTEFALFSEAEQIQEFGLSAELCIAGSQLTSGYLDEPEKNRSAFFVSGNQRFYRSGDLCLRDEQGEYFFTGRNDTQVKINGYRIEVSEIESHARNIPGVDDAVVLVNRDGNQPTLQLVCCTHQPVDPDTIREFLRARIPEYMIPSAFFFRDSFPVNLNGKTDRTAIAAGISTSENSL
jgi:D-alanine--poly(phosphoribitol) ligase subunit 1